MTIYGFMDFLAEDTTLNRPHSQIPLRQNLKGFCYLNNVKNKGVSEWHSTALKTHIRQPFGPCLIHLMLNLSDVFFSQWFIKFIF